MAQLAAEVRARIRALADDLAALEGGDGADTAPVARAVAALHQLADGLDDVTLRADAAARPLPLADRIHSLSPPEDCGSVGEDLTCTAAAVELQPEGPGTDGEPADLADPAPVAAVEAAEAPLAEAAVRGEAPGISWAGEDEDADVSILRREARPRRPPSSPVEAVAAPSLPRSPRPADLIRWEDDTGAALVTIVHGADDPRPRPHRKPPETRDLGDSNPDQGTVRLRSSLGPGSGSTFATAGLQRGLLASRAKAVVLFSRFLQTVGRRGR